MLLVVDVLLLLSEPNFDELFAIRALGEQSKEAGKTLIREEFLLCFLSVAIHYFPEQLEPCLASICKTLVLFLVNSIAVRNRGQ